MKQFQEETLNDKTMQVLTRYIKWMATESKTYT